MWAYKYLKDVNFLLTKYSSYPTHYSASQHHLNIGNHETHAVPTQVTPASCSLPMLLFWNGTSTFFLNKDASGGHACQFWRLKHAFLYYFLIYSSWKPAAQVSRLIQDHLGLLPRPVALESWLKVGIVLSSKYYSSIGMGPFTKAELSRVKCYL